MTSMTDRPLSAYGKYQQSRNASWQCLIDCGVDRLPVAVSDIAAKLSVKLCEYGDNEGLLRRHHLDPLLEAAGFAYANPDGRLLIFFNEKDSRQQLRFTIAHELGHILLGHVGPELPRGRFLTPSDPRLERAADRFAERLLAPACILWAREARTPEEIAALCDIPMETARSRARRMQSLLRRNAWLRSPLERQLYAQFHFSADPPEGEG